MRQRQIQKEPYEKQVASINTDYLRSVQRRESRIKSKKVRLFRRLAVFFIVSIAVTGFLIMTLVNSHQTLAEKKEQQVQVEEELAKVQEDQEMLKIQISKLNDDDYIGKLLRKEFFLSEEGEIIFSLPEENDK
ncbi:septum formation initiator family protein [uncultured Psychrobacillus sp.]|uniref:FtsB family cell division protein n=1 Tax=uncultured Psychrobacillus sp. TaxID=1551585 RepID=UPI0026352E16|nr:septum formation initiator family protein [uncultured Psychrobacillus sp.]